MSSDSEQNETSHLKLKNSIIMLQAKVDDLELQTHHNDSKLRSKLDYILKEVQKLRAFTDLSGSDCKSEPQKPCCKKKSK
jgi:hypothetical protein